MHASKFTLIAVLSCIAMTGAIPVGNGVVAEAIVRRQGGGGSIIPDENGNRGPFNGLVPYNLQLPHVEVLTCLKFTPRG